VTIRGFSSCKCLRIYLRPKSKEVERFPNMVASSRLSSREPPTSDADATHREYLGGAPMNDDDIINNTEPLDNLAGREPWLKSNCSGEKGEEASPSGYGPILTFAIPDCEANGKEDSSPPPPLLWKVWMPPDPTICIETLTVLDGTLDVESAAPDPSAVYVNGYQSWSYAGTVKRGHPQPASAMPHILSRAFNRGATVPPKSQTGLRKNATGGVLGADCEGWDDNGQDDDNKKHELRSFCSADEVDAGAAKSRASRKRKNEDYLDDEEEDDDERHFYKSDLFACITSQSPAVAHVGQQDDENEQFVFTSGAGPSLVLGSLSQRKQFGLVTLCPDLCDISMQCSLDGTVPCLAGGLSTDWSYAQIVPGRERHPFHGDDPSTHYINAVAAHNGAKPMRHGVLLTGWCSWYHYYENIEESMLRQTFDTLGGPIRNKIMSNVGLIDDGYMTAWGDWGSLKPKAFPTAFMLGPNPTDKDVDACMKSLSDSMQSNGMKPGIWLAPFAADKHSKLTKEHPDWIICDNAGRPANSSNCGKFFYGLDATNPEVREHVFRTIRRAVSVWGFEVLKIDFLYAACLKGNGKHDASMSRAEAMHLALRCIRAGAGSNTFLIGCGCPLGTAVGYIDGMRISADTGPTWQPGFPLPSWDHSTLPSLRAMVRNSITRSNFGHRWWHNDPDCILLGETTELTDEEVVSAATVVGMTGGMMLMSDDLTKLRHNRLRIITRVFPVTGATALSVDLHHPSRAGIPSLLRLWCTDETATSDVVVGGNDDGSSEEAQDPNALAIRTAWSIAFNPDRKLEDSSPGMRNRVHVAKGLGQWSVISLSNWSNIPATVAVPMSICLPPPPTDKGERGDDALSAGSSLGYHVVAFWSSKYVWIPKKQIDNKWTLSKMLDPHETEVFHVKPVKDEPQYIGSDIHFTCGYEVRHFKTNGLNELELAFKSEWRRSGYAFLFIPSSKNLIRATVNGRSGNFDVIAKPSLGEGKSGRVVRVWVTIRGDGKDEDGIVVLKF